MVSLKKQIAVLGSTGSIGQQALDVIRAFPDKFRVVALAAGANAKLLAKQVDEFKPALVFCQDTGILASLTSNKFDFLTLDDIARHPDVDIVVVATSGNSGLSPTLAAVKAGKTVALSNKESLVAAGQIINSWAKSNGARILPVDSEHSAIWQCLNGENQKPARLILTASGGPFREYSPAQLEDVTAEQALKHPSWQMGKKVTIDSATLMNKGLEVIEAHWLFDMPYENIKVVIHPQSIIHSMVEFADGSIKAQLSYPDMRLPIQYALTYPERWSNPDLPRLDWKQINCLQFQSPDFQTFPCLRIAVEAGIKGGTYPAVLSAADEMAVELFLAQKIKFTQIAAFVESVLAEHRAIAQPSLEEILDADAWAREKTVALVGGGCL